MNVFYPLKTEGSKHRDFELRMSLRSIEKHLSNVDQVFIATEILPDWIDNVTQVHVKDQKNHVPDRNIAEKTAQCPSEDFLFMNDDHFLLQPYDAETFPYYHAGSLDEYCRRRGLDGYGRRANNTLKHLKANNLPTLHFDCHYPIRYNLTKFKQHVMSLDWTKKDGYIIKSLYANAERIEGIQVIENKTLTLPKNTPVFSTYPHLKCSVQRFLIEQFPHKSRFEKTGI